MGSLTSPVDHNSKDAGDWAYGRRYLRRIVTFSAVISKAAVKSPQLFQVLGSNPKTFLMVVLCRGGGSCSDAWGWERYDNN